MVSAQGTGSDERVMPAAIPDASDSDHVRIGEQVEEILDHPGFQALVHALHIHSESTLRHRMLRKADSDAAIYADVMGHLRGLSEVVPIARGLVQNGKEVAERRHREGVS
jgi:hypothetical protein